MIGAGAGVPEKRNPLSGQTRILLNEGTGMKDLKRIQQVIADGKEISFTLLA